MTADRLFDLEKWVLDVGYGPDDKSIRVPLTRDQAMEIDPRFTTEWESWTTRVAAAGTPLRPGTVTRAFENHVTACGLPISCACTTPGTVPAN